ncbi:MAG: hypothetical protein KIT84_17405 [Labilithrix sp.]|nr:hypothetical protein [Labilithrix sp.]MCW5812809.1 hypothetical protein [Labilithrix sp.]
MRRALALALVATVATACIGTTGSETVTFRAFAAGPAGVQGHALTFVNGRGWTITLTSARLHVGALYLNRSVPISGGQERECFLPGVYVAQVWGGADIDVLEPELQPFPYSGNGTADRAVTGEVWLTGGRIDAQEDRTTIAEVGGTATKDGVTRRFEGTITIGQNRANRSTDPARPGANPLCGQRIVTPIPTDVTPTDGGSLILHVDPRPWFGNVDLADLKPVTADSDLVRFADDGSDAASANLYGGLRGATGGAYAFTWRP